MSTIKDYSIIETQWIENRINIYKGFLINSQDLDKINIYQALIDELKDIKSKLKPLTPIVENAFNAGGESNHNWGQYAPEIKEERQDYINNTIIE
jgi:hypothetical protein